MQKPLPPKVKHDTQSDTLEGLKKHLYANAKQVVANANYGLGKRSSSEWHRDLQHARVIDTHRQQAQFNLQRQYQEEQMQAMSTNFETNRKKKKSRKKKTSEK